EDAYAVLTPDEQAAGVVGGPHQLDPAAVAVRKATSERDGRDRSSGKPRQQCDALGVAGDGFARRRRGGKRVNFFELLAGEPPDLVELVDAHDEDEAAASPSERRRRGLRVPLPTRDQRKVTESPAHQLLPQADELGNE